MIGGMDIRIMGGSYQDLMKHWDARDMRPYFEKANEMIKDGRIFFVRPMRCKPNGCPTRFQYGGGWACNSCNTCINTPAHWKIKVMKDGNSYCCVGDGFEDLQSSDNYAFGYSFDGAISNYEKKFFSEGGNNG
jgi:hypothetical protein